MKKISWTNEKEKPNQNQAWIDYKERGGKVVDVGRRGRE